MLLLGGVCLIKRHPLFPVHFDYFGHEKKRIGMATKKARPDEAIVTEDLIWQPEVGPWAGQQSAPNEAIQAWLAGPPMCPAKRVIVIQSALMPCS